MTRKILCVAVHPDDETLAAGGSLLKWKKEGHEIHWLILTKIDEAGGFSAEKVLKRSKEIELVSNRYQFNSVTKLNFLTTTLDKYSISEMVSEISKVIVSLKVDTILIPHRFDAHSDHRKAYEALMPFMKSFRYPFIKNVLAMETLSETGYSASDAREAFFPNLYVDISNEMNEKIAIMKLYNGELLPHPFPRSEDSLLALGKLRGAFISTEYAEAFQIIKMTELF